MDDGRVLVQALSPDASEGFMTKQGRARRFIERASKDEYRLMNARLRQAIDRDDRKENGFLWEGWEPREWCPTLIHKGGKP